MLPHEVKGVYIDLYYTTVGFILTYCVRPDMISLWPKIFAYNVFGAMLPSILRRRYMHTVFSHWGRNTAICIL